MSVKEFSGGLSELFGESSISGQANSTAQNPDTSSESVTSKEEEDLINSVEDENLKEALRKRRLQGNGRPRKGDSSPRSSDGYERACMIVNAEKYAKIKAISMKETLPIKDVIEAAMDVAIEAYEKKHGEIHLNSSRGDASKLFK